MYVFNKITVNQQLPKRINKLMDIIIEKQANSNQRNCWFPSPKQITKYMIKYIKNDIHTGNNLLFSFIMIPLVTLIHKNILNWLKAPVI